MPTYEFRCPAGHDFEHFHARISDAPAELPCPECGTAAVRRISGGAGLIFKGSGFYITDYGKDGKKDQKAPDRGGAAAEKGDAGAKGEGAAKGEGSSKGESSSKGEGSSKGDKGSAAPASPSGSSAAGGSSSGGSSGGGSGSGGGGSSAAGGA